MAVEFVFCTFVLRNDGSVYFSTVGPEVTEILGLSAATLRNDARSARPIVHPEDLERVGETIADSAKNLTQWHCEYRIQHPQKGVRWIEGRSTPRREPDGSIAWDGILSDITDRKCAEADHEFLLALGVELQGAEAPDAIMRVAIKMLGDYLEIPRSTLSAIDLPSNSVRLLCEYPPPAEPSPAEPYPLDMWADPTFIQVAASGVTIAISDTSTDPITANYYAAAFQPARIDALVVIPMRRAGQWLAALTLMSPVPRAWSRREIDLARAIVERMWPTYDVARALASERALHEELAAGQARLHLALQTAALGVWEADPQTGQRRWDERCRSIFGFPPDLPVDRQAILSCVHPEDRDMVRDAIHQYMDPAHDGRLELEYRILTWDEGKLRYVYGKGQTFFEGEGSGRRAVRSFGTLQDTTALKQGEQTLRRMNQELEQFAYAAAHDLQEPLRCTSLATQLLFKRYNHHFDGEALELLQTAFESTGRMQEMIRALLSFSRVLDQEGEAVVPVDSDNVLSLALRNLDVAIREKRVEISLETLPPVRMRESHLLQIFQNLIGNAIKYSGDKLPVVRIFSTRRKGVCLFCVKDNGIGIAPEYHERIFRIFKRLHREDIPGTGMGLALCKRIVEHYGGKIWVESEKGQGTTVLFSPPVTDERSIRIN